MTAENARAEQTVFIVDDDASICEAMCNLLGSERIAALAFASTEAFLQHWQPAMPGCLLLDVRLPGMMGTAFQEELRRRDVAIPIVFMTAHGDIPMVRKVMKAGAVEFLTKPFQKEELLSAIRQAFARDAVQRAEQDALNEVRGRYTKLTPREREVMECVATGLPNKQIAAALGVSEITVKIHRHNVMEKMDAGSLADLIRMADRLHPQTRH